MQADGIEKLREKTENVDKVSTVAKKFQKYKFVCKQIQILKCYIVFFKIRYAWSVQSILFRYSFTIVSVNIIVH